MDSNVLRIGVACFVALSVSSPAMSATPEADLAAIEANGQGAGDSLLLFLIGTGGDTRVETVDAGLDAAFASISKANAGAVPGFLRDVRALGLAQEVRSAVECGLADRVQSSTLSGSEKAALMGSMNGISGSCNDLADSSPSSSKQAMDKGCGGESTCEMNRNAYIS